MELGSQGWLDRCRERLNNEVACREAVEGWSCSLGLAFLDDDGEPLRHALLELDDGRCRTAIAVGADRFAEAPVRLSASDEQWQRALSGEMNPIKAMMLRRVRVDGDLLHIVKHATEARALFACFADAEDAEPASDTG